MDNLIKKVEAWFFKRNLHSLGIAGFKEKKNFSKYLGCFTLPELQEHLNNRRVSYKPTRDRL